MTSALTSLTDTYTDSEGEEFHHHEEAKKTPKSKVQEKQEGNEKPRGRMNLVSYGDDTILSDDEGDKHTSGSSVVILMPPRPATPAFLEPVESPVQNGSEDAEMKDAPEPEVLPVFTDVEMPPEPKGSCTFELQQKIYDLTDKMQTRNVDMNQIIQERKAFRNPSIYEKLIQFCNINEFGTNYEPHIYDPLKWGKDSFYDELAKSQKQDMDLKVKERKVNPRDKIHARRPQIEIVVGTKKSTNGSANSEEEVKRRQSKWDQVGTFSTSSVLKATTAGMHNLTTSATGTKSTVISAFGSLPKKPKM